MTGALGVSLVWALSARFWRAGSTGALPCSWTAGAMGAAVTLSCGTGWRLARAGVRVGLRDRPLLSVGAAMWMPIAPSWGWLMGRLALVRRMGSLAAAALAVKRAAIARAR